MDNDGYYYIIQYSSLNRGERPNIVSKFNPFSIYNIKNYIKLNKMSCILISTTYLSTDEKLKFKCACGDYFLASWHLFKGSYKSTCNKCSTEKLVSKQRYTFTHVYNAFKKNGYTLLESTYQNGTTPMKCKDDLGYLYLIPLDRIGVVGSYKVHSKNPYSIQNINMYIQKNNIDIKLISKNYTDRNAMLCFKCSCGDLFYTSWDSFNQQNIHRCRKCSKKMSKGEYSIKKYLDSNNIKYILESPINNKDKKNLLKFDFKIIIDKKFFFCEFQGEQHYRPVKHWGGDKNFIAQQERDSYKREYCIKNNIKLLEIPYWEFENMEKILSEFILKFKKLTL